MQTILHLIPHAHLGGCERNCEMYISAAPNEHHVVLVLDGPGPMTPLWEKHGARVVHLNALSNNELLYKTLKTWSSESQFSSIIYWSPTKLPVVRSAFKGQKCVFAVHMGNPVSMGLISTLKFLITDLLKPSCQETVLFCCSRHVQSTLRHNWYFRRFKSLVVLNPVATLPSNPHVVKELQGKDPVVVGMTARLDMIKDHACVIRAFSAVLHRYPHAQLWFMGDGVLRSSLQQLCADLHIDKSVVFHGNVPNVYDYLQKLDIFVYSTTMAEGLGNVVSEAFANGLPCVISDLPMMREVAGDSRAALFFEPGNDKELAQRIVDLLRDAEKRESMSSSAYKWSSEAFSAQRYVNEGMKFLRQNENE